MREFLCLTLLLFIQNRDIVAYQDDLRGICTNANFRSAGMVFISHSFFSAVLLERVKTAEKDMDKLSSGNATLQMYIDNLTLQMAKRR